MNMLDIAPSIDLRGTHRPLAHPTAPRAPAKIESVDLSGPARIQRDLLMSLTRSEPVRMDLVQRVRVDIATGTYEDDIEKKTDAILDELWPDMAIA